MYYFLFCIRSGYLKKQPHCCCYLKYVGVLKRQICPRPWYNGNYITKVLKIKEPT